VGFLGVVFNLHAGGQVISPGIGRVKSHHRPLWQFLAGGSGHITPAAEGGGTYGGSSHINFVSLPGFIPHAWGESYHLGWVGSSQITDG